MRNFSGLPEMQTEARYPLGTFGFHLIGRNLSNEYKEHVQRHKSKGNRNNGKFYPRQHCRGMQRQTAGPEDGLFLHKVTKPTESRKRLPATKCPEKNPDSYNMEKFISHASNNSKDTSKNHFCFI